MQTTAGTAAVNGATIAYDVTGSGPPVFLISGGGTLDRRMWDEQVPVLSQRHTVVRYDVRGIGGSSPPTGSFSHSEDLYSLAQHLRTTPAYFVGLSFGAAIAIDLALDHPDVVRGLVLAAPGLSSDKDANLRDALTAAELARKNGLPSVIDAIVSNPMVLSAANAHVRERVKRIYLDNAAVFASDFALVRLWRPTSPPAVKRLASIRVPALVVVGDQDSDHVRATADELAGRIDGAQLVVLRGGGHLLNLDVPGEFNNAISTFLAKPR